MERGRLGGRLRADFGTCGGANSGGQQRAEKSVVFQDLVSLIDFLYRRWLGDSYARNWTIPASADQKLLLTTEIFTVILCFTGW